MQKQNEVYTRLFYLILLTNFTINLDHGIIPAATLKIKESLNMTDEQLGLLGSLVYGGIVIVSLFVGHLFLYCNAKILIILAISLMSISLFLFTISFQYQPIYYLLRFITGVSQAPLIVYFPVWIDHFGNENKTIWMTLLQGIVPFGIFSGYVISSIVSEFEKVKQSSQQFYKWQLSFYIQIFLVIPIFISFTNMKNEDFDIKKINNYSANQQPTLTLYKLLFTNIIYLCFVFLVAVLYFTVTGIQFWMTYYLQTVLKYPQYLVNMTFSLTSITAPVAGCFFGGFVTDKTGGYDSDNAILVTQILGMLGGLGGLYIPFSNNLYVVTALIWWMLFFGGGIIPPATGIMLSSVPKEIRSFANSNATFIVTLLGFGPAPFIYGLLTQLGTRAGVFFLMYYPLVGYVFVIVAYLKRKSYKKMLEDQGLD